MTVQVRTFGVAKEIVGAPSVGVDVNSNGTVNDLKAVLESRFPQLRQLASYRIALNNEFASAEQVVRAGDEVALIPPVSGG